MDAYRIVAHNIRRLRLGLDLNRARLAEKSGLSRSFIGRLESGKRGASLDTIGLVATALHCLTADLFARIQGEHLFDCPAAKSGACDCGVVA